MQVMGGEVCVCQPLAGASGFTGDMGATGQTGVTGGWTFLPSHEPRSTTLNPTSAWQAMMPLYPVAIRPPITSPRDQLDLITGVSPMRSSIRLERATMESKRSTRSHYRGPSDAGVDPSSVTDRLRVDLTIVVIPIRSLTSIDQSFWPRGRQIKHYPGSAVSVRLQDRGGSTFLHLLVGVGDTLSVFLTLGKAY